MLWCVLYPEGGVLSGCCLFCILRGCFIMLWCVLYPEGVFYHVVVCFVS